MCRFDAVIHFAGLKAVGESVQKPLLYYNNNLIGTINLLETMAAHGCKKVIIFPCWIYCCISPSLFFCFFFFFSFLSFFLL